MAMKAVFHDARTGQQRALEPQEPPRLRWAAAELGAPGTLARERGRLLAAALERALRSLGYEPRAGGAPELFFGEAGAPEGALWLKPGPGPEEPLSLATARGVPEGDLLVWALRARYREARPFSWAELEAARSERAALVSAARALAARHAGAAPNAAGLAGYRKRFREALARDFDAPEALASLWDALRPGALSPGSQLAALREAEDALGLGLFSGS
jgi:hypothetical protein